jgi:hypothetical protein
MTAPAGDVDRLAAALRLASGTSPPRDDCPPAERIWDALHGQANVEERRAIVDHTVACPTCAEAWRLAMELGPPRSVPASARSRERSWRPASSWTWIAAAAGLFLVAGTLFFSRSALPPGDPVVRDPNRGELRSLVPSGARLPRDAFRLRWTPGPSEARYELTVTTTDLTVLVMVRGLEHPQYDVPAGRLAGLESGARVLWRVVARTPGGAAVASPTFEASID